ncbi:MAG: SDR family oxidoreductase [Gammaproteobacteria bacterium]|nr:SDR family oxidoreductase [Gammaproteobacteria bacterium]
MNDKTALITGASAGIGKAFAIKFAREGWNLVITARRQPQLETLAVQLREQYKVKVTVIIANLSETDAPQEIFDEISKQAIQIDALVNNAGYGVPGYYANTSWKQQADFLQVLITSVAHLSHLFLPGMIERGYGRIINVSSLNGLLPCSPGQSLYAGAKAFVISLSHTLQAEAGDRGVNVSALCPGLTYTEFHDVTGTREMTNKVPKSQWLDADTVAEQSYDAVMRGDLLCITGRSSKIAAIAAKILPRPLMVKLMKKQSLKFRKAEV